MSFGTFFSGSLTPPFTITSNLSGSISMKTGMIKKDQTYTFHKNRLFSILNGMAIIWSLSLVAPTLCLPHIFDACNLPLPKEHHFIKCVGLTLIDVLHIRTPPRQQLPWPPFTRSCPFSHNECFFDRLTSCQVDIVTPWTVRITTLCQSLPMFWRYRVACVLCWPWCHLHPLVSYAFLATPACPKDAIWILGH